MKTCRDCFFCTPNYKGGVSMFRMGVCYQAQRKVLANMTACNLFEERGKEMPVKSNTEKRNHYRDKDDNVIQGVTLPEVLNEPLTIIAKRDYAWGLYDGLAVKVSRESGELLIVEITAETPIKALCMPQLPKLPFPAKFVQRVSKNKRRYFTIEVLDNANVKT